jgi:RNA polymerase sigma-70 factor (ECF subfamily)
VDVVTLVRAPEEARPLPALADDVDIDRDRNLVRRAQQGDRTAFDDLYARYYQRLWRFCLKRLQDEHEAEDVAQEAFVRAWQALPGFAGERRFYPWLSVIAAHLCSNVVRKRNRADPVAELPDRNLASFEGCGEDHVMATHDSAVAARALAHLSPRHRAVLDLREERGWSYQRIADHQGVRVSTVEALLWRARAALKREFAAQSGEGRLGGAVGLLAFGLRRLLRAPQAAVDRWAVAMPSAGTLAVGSAALAVTAAGVVGSLVPGPGAAPGRAGDDPPATLPGLVAYVPGPAPTIPAPGTDPEPAAAGTSSTGAGVVVLGAPQVPAPTAPTGIAIVPAPPSAPAGPAPPVPSVAPAPAAVRIGGTIQALTPQLSLPGS